MTSRALVLTVAAAAAALSFASLPANMVLAQPAAPAATAPAATPDATTPDQAAPKGKKRAKKTTSRQKEIDRSVESGTVPRRYMQNVPKQYHDSIPWAKQ